VPVKHTIIASQEPTNLRPGIHCTPLLIITVVSIIAFVFFMKPSSPTDTDDDDDVYLKKDYNEGVTKMQTNQSNK
jgi:hypothetical protein